MSRAALGGGFVDIVCSDKDGLEKVERVAISGVVQGLAWLSTLFDPNGSGFGSVLMWLLYIGYCIYQAHGGFWLQAPGHGTQERSQKQRLVVRTTYYASILATSYFGIALPLHDALVSFSRERYFSAIQEGFCVAATAYFIYCVWHAFRYLHTSPNCSTATSLPGMDISDPLVSNASRDYRGENKINTAAQEGKSITIASKPMKAVRKISKMC